MTRNKRYKIVCENETDKEKEARSLARAMLADLEQYSDNLELENYLVNTILIPTISVGALIDGTYTRPVLLAYSTNDVVISVDKRYHLEVNPWLANAGLGSGVRISYSDPELLPKLRKIVQTVEWIYGHR